ncbi:High-affinity branched-chain amino acid transport ATP-binding protein braG [Bradyrhizobium sp. STM 3843]|uniref:ABC transporter ATP-binding protein n=1 Tax=Bradyrhizobium sp. STM 3843 TaxID=551947 RepID=UPI0002406C46|nr:ABC transporter ATP-binding protein [Bradyrhizobium sp. STM 3843]CCE06232.1 High-affinity branched-chain amino acid transport ATP-binding protein braG [Bradyrhizobium sp. STM 3843]
MPDAASLRLSDVEAWYGDSQVLFGVGFAVRQGEVTCLVGRNGAGKTTILRAIMGLLPRQTGSIVLSGYEASGMRPYERTRFGIGYCPEERAIFSSLTVEENLALPPAVCAAGMANDEIFALFPNLRTRGRHYGDQLSGGEQQMLAIARILRTGAQTLLLDEPTEGLAPVVVRQIEQALIELKRRGYTILLVEQNLDFVLHLADRVVAIENGEVVDDLETQGGEHVRARLLQRLAL